MTRVIQQVKGEKQGVHSDGVPQDLCQGSSVLPLSAARPSPGAQPYSSARAMNRARTDIPALP